MKKVFYSLEEASIHPESVQTLSLRDADLKELDSRIDSFVNLQHLTINNTSLKALPASLGKLPNLQSLNLSSNRLSSLPAEIGNLTNLQLLDLRFNSLSNLPDETGHLSKLTDLNLSHNSLTALPESIGRLTHLRYLDLSFNSLLSLPDSISQLTDLIHLNISKNQLQLLPADIGQLTKLMLLRLNDNLLEALPESMGQLPQLRRLELSFNRLESLPNAFGNLSGLTALNLGHNYLTELPASFGLLQSLRKLTLDDNPIADFPAAVGLLGTLPNLRVLSLQHNVLTEPFREENKLGIVMNTHAVTELPSLSGLAGLTHLNLSNNQFTTIPSSVRELRHLRKLDLEENPIREIRPDAVLQQSPYVKIRFPRNLQPDLQEMDRMIRQYNRTGTPEKIRLLSSLLYLKAPQEAWEYIQASFTIPELLPLLDSEDGRLRKTVMAFLRSKLGFPFEGPLNMSTRVFHLTGQFEILTQAQLTDWLKGQGAKVSTDFSPGVTHLVAGIGAGKIAELAFNGNTLIVFEHDLIRLRDKVEKPFLREETPEALKMQESVRELLYSRDSVNTVIGLQTMQGGGVPDNLLGAVLALYLCHPEAETRVAAGLLFRKYASLSLQAHVRICWRTNYSENPIKAIHQGYLEDVLAHAEADGYNLLLMVIGLTGTGNHLLDKYQKAPTQPSASNPPPKPKRRFWEFWKK